jgi:WXG100 family type VII secretion target
LKIIDFNTLYAKSSFNIGAEIDEENFFLHVNSVKMASFTTKGVTMATIHVNTDTLRSLGQLFVKLNEQIQNDLGPQIGNMSSNLESDWQGKSRAHYDTLYQDWKAKTTSIVQTGEDLGRHLQNTATQLENADQSM